jgi:YesN/AraC family two-component response regulator
MNTNFIVIEAINGEDALGKAKKYKPDIVVSDVLMPVMDGLRFCENLKSLPDLMQIPVILLTAKSDGYSNKIAFEKGADAFVSKPFIYEVLESRIFNLIKNRDELQKKYTLRPDFTPGFYTNKKHEIKFLEKVYQIICQNISNEDFRVEELAAKVAMSRIQLYRKIHNLTGSGPSTLIRKIRLSFAKKLIEAEHEKPIAEIALTSGFQGISHFNRSFKEEFKISPGAYKRRLVNNE